MSHTVRRIAVFGALSLGTMGLSSMAMTPASAEPVTLAQPARPSQTIVISQVSTQGPGGARDEFIELRNINESELDISNYKVFACTGTGTQVQLATIPQGTILQGSISTPGVEFGQYYLLAGRDYSRATTPDQVYNGDIQRLGGVMLRGTPTTGSPSGMRIDSVGFDRRNACVETAPAPAQSLNQNVDESVLRVSDMDTNNNAFDFVRAAPAQPRNSTSSSTTTSSSSSSSSSASSPSSS